MSKLLLKTQIRREKDKLYFCATDELGNITVNEAVMRRSGRKKKEQ